MSGIQHFTIEETLNAPNKMTFGSDVIPSFLVKDLATVFAETLLFLFNLILSTWTFPERWKTFKVTLVCEFGDQTNISNYLPTSLLSNFSKVFKFLLFHHIYKAVKAMLSATQFSKKIIYFNKFNYFYTICRWRCWQGRFLYWIF